MYADISPENNYFDQYGRDMKDPTLKLRKVKIAKKGLGTILGSIIQIAAMALGDTEYLFNTSYLELDFDKMWWLIGLPYMNPIFSGWYFPFMSGYGMLYFFIFLVFHFVDLNEPEVFNSERPKLDFYNKY